MADSMMDESQFEKRLEEDSISVVNPEGESAPGTEVHRDVDESIMFGQSELGDGSGRPNNKIPTIQSAHGHPFDQRRLHNTFVQRETTIT